MLQVFEIPSICVGAGGDSAPDVPVLKRARSFSKYLTQYAEHLDFALPTTLAMPASAHLALWSPYQSVRTQSDRKQSTIGLVHMLAVPLGLPIFDVFLDGCPPFGQLIRF